MWSVITVYTFYHVYFIHVTIRNEFYYLLLLLITYVLFILHCKIHSTLLILDNFFPSTFLWHVFIYLFHWGYFPYFGALTKKNVKDCLNGLCTLAKIFKARSEVLSLEIYLKVGWDC